MSEDPQDRLDGKESPMVVGLYGIGGSGKTTLLNDLKNELGSAQFAYFEGSEVIGNFAGGIEAFKTLEEHKKDEYRRQAINSIREECKTTRKAGIVTCHFRFWEDENDPKPENICTPNDRATFTHIIYLGVSAADLEKRRSKDSNTNVRGRKAVSVGHLYNWQESEKIELREMCYRHHILFFILTLSPNVVEKASQLICDFRGHNAETNLDRAYHRLEEVLEGQPMPETMLALDADKTLTPKDTGIMFFKNFGSLPKPDDWLNPLNQVFRSNLNHSYLAFRQATLLYEENTSDEEFEFHCQKVAEEVTMHPEFASLLWHVLRTEHVGAVVITAGIRRVWEKVLERYGLSEKVKVIGGGRLHDKFVVDRQVKGKLVSRMRTNHQMYVYAFGDSETDVDMLLQADEATIVVGEGRSPTSEETLRDSIDNESLRGHQVLLPSHTRPLVDPSILPVLELTNPEFLASIFRRPITLTDASKTTASKILATTMRDARNAGPKLRDAHRRAGYHLATRYVSELIGVEEIDIKHVKEHLAKGYQLQDEQQTLIIALMRAGEPMAYGVSDAFPLAPFLHVKNPPDLELRHLQGVSTVLLVDAVINTGQTILDQVKRIQELDSTVRIVVVAGIVQHRAFDKNELLRKELGRGRGIEVVALRLSTTKFVGSGKTDTGNRLFGTTHWD